MSPQDAQCTSCAQRGLPPEHFFPRVLFSQTRGVLQCEGRTARSCRQNQPCLHGVRQSSQPPRSVAPSQQGTDRSRAFLLIRQRQLGTSPPENVTSRACSLNARGAVVSEGCIRRGASERRSIRAALPRHGLRANRSYSTTFIQPISKGDYQ